LKAGRPDAEASNLDEMDAALRKFLEMQTITAEDNLRSGIFDAPEGGWGDDGPEEP
jgi:hypothetical protein